jgi:hypothetical protein
MPETSENNLMDEMLELFPLENFQVPTSLLEDSLVRLFQSRVSELDSPWMTPEGHSLLRCLDSQAKKEYLTYSLRMLKVSSTTTEEEPSKSSSRSWMAWGMTVNGSCLTAKISASHSTEKGYSLSDILEETPDQKYFLSEQQVEAMMKRTRKNEKEGRGFSPTFLRPSTPITTKEETLDSM